MTYMIRKLKQDFCPNPSIAKQLRTYNATSWCSTLGLLHPPAKHTALRGANSTDKVKQPL